MGISKITLSKEYSIVSTFDFIEGMTIPYELYYVYNGKLTPALRSSTLTKLSLIQLQRLEMTFGDIYVKAEEFESLQKIIKHFKNNESYKKFIASYNNIQTQADNIIKKAFKTHSIDKRESELIIANIKNTLFNSDSSQIIQAINNVTSEDEYLYNHSINVGFLNGLMGKWLHLSEEDISKLVKIGFLHDIGKIRIPENILNKPDVLTDDEFEVIKLHPVHSFNMLVETGERDKDILLAVRGHHEKTNGTGYPDKLDFGKISLYARITTISDIYDAMVSKRVYKDNQSPFVVLDEFSKGRFSNLDTSLVNTFLRNMPNELLGKKAILSDGRIGVVTYINPSNYSYPLVRVGEEVIVTSEKLKCLSMCE